MDAYIIPSLHNEHDLACTYRSAPNELRVLLRNVLGTSLRLTTDPGPAPRIVLDLNALGPVTLDPARVTCTGFSVTSWSNGVLVLQLAVAEYWWFDGDALAIGLSAVTTTAEVGPHVVTVALENVPTLAVTPQGIAVVVLAPSADAESGAALAVGWVNSNVVAVSPPGREGDSSALAFEVQPYATSAARAKTSGTGDGRRLIVTLGSGAGGRLGALARPADAAAIAVRARGWATQALPGTVVPAWVLRPAPAQSEAIAPRADDAVMVQLDGINADVGSGTAHVVVYNLDFPDAPDGYAVLAVKVVNGSVQIPSFTVSPTQVANISAPATVNLSWTTVNASVVTLSGVGVVPAAQTNLPIAIEETTTFVLTAFDSALDQIASQAVTVTVTPDLVSRLVPQGTIVMWTGTTPPPNWAVCNGQNGTPNLTDRFIMGAGGTQQPGASGAADTHTHLIPTVSSTFLTTFDGSHSHGMPTNWYARKLSSGSKTGIDTRGPFTNNTQSQSAGVHQHYVQVTFGASQSGANNGGVRPPWYALAYIMKL